MKSLKDLYSDCALTTKRKSNVPKVEIGTKSTRGSNGRLANSGTLTAVPLVSMVSVCPSGALDKAARAAGMPPAPGMFSTMSRCPSFSLSLSATILIVTSATPPAPNGTMILTGRAG